MKAFYFLSAILIAKIKDTPVMKWNSRRVAEIFFLLCFLGALIMSLIVTSEL